MTAQPGKPRKASPKYNLGEGGVSREVYYRDRTTGWLVVRVHQLEKADGTLRDGDAPDPKELCIGEAEYHMYPGGKWWHRARREPERLLPTIWLKRRYGDFRRFTCRRWGW